MFWRYFSFFISQVIGSLLGLYFDLAKIGVLSALMGAMAGTWVWFILDFWRAARLMRWLRLGNTANVAMRGGFWGEAADRARRLTRAREQMTRDSQNQLQDFLSAFQASPNGVVLLDAEGQIEWCNQMAAAHFGLQVQRDLMQHFGNLVRDPRFVSYFAAQDYRSDVVMPGRQSTPTHPVQLSVQLHRYGEGRLLLLSRDVTVLEQAEAMRRDFVANVSHEIRTPLTVLSGFVETLQTLPLNEADRSRYLSLMAQQADRMQMLVNDLLTLSRLEGSPSPGAGEWLPIPEVMGQLERDARALSTVLNPSADRPHTMVFDSLPNGAVAGAPSELISAMSNLVSNAVRYTPARGEIRVCWRVLPDARAEFSVSDTGPGIASEHLPRLTERFYRVDRSRSRDTGGTGLGLAIVKHVCQRHGAQLKIESTLGKGSTFSIVFPTERIQIGLSRS
jgi:two-component system phosphate regulon sensor histidine kinase PhoR